MPVLRHLRDRSALSPVAGMHRCICCHCVLCGLIAEARHQGRPVTTCSDSVTKHTYLALTSQADTIAGLEDAR